MKKLATLIGINYVGTKSELGGCINDTKLLVEKLVNDFNFNTHNIQLLLEETATKKNILESIERLVEELEPGDLGVLTYSGHGTQTADLPPVNEEDMLDEAIVPFNAVQELDNLIRDDEINEILGKLKNDVRFIVIFDSCHSATGTREIGKTRMFPPSIAVQEINRIRTDILTLDNEKPKRHPLSGMNHILLAGCKANELSFDDGTNGYFTKELVKNMKKGISYQELYESTYKAVVERSNNRQNPQIEGRELTRKIFE